MQDSITEQVIKYQIQTKIQTLHKTHYQKDRRVSHQKRKTDKPVYHHEHANTNHTPERRITPQRQKQKRKTTRHIPPLTSQHHPATPADPDPHPIPPTYFLPTSLPSPIPTPYPHPFHTLNYTLLTTPCPHTACRHCTHHLFYHPSPLYHHPCLHPCSQLYPCLSRSRYRSPSTLLSRSLTVATSPLAWLPLFTCTTTIRLLSAYCSHVCLHYCAHPAYCLGSSPCATHDPSFSPSVCHPSHLRYHQSLTRVHSHSLPVPPPLPLADARS